MAQTAAGAMKTAAKRLGLSVADHAARVQAGLKSCRKCRSWKPVAEFAFDRSRGDGRKTICKGCDCTRTQPGPAKRERDAMKVQGLTWCRSCEKWLPVAEVRAGLCRPHINQYARDRYQTSETFRLNRRQHSYSRKRGLSPIPAFAQAEILAEFDGMCAYCDSPAASWDHIIPVAKGGRSVPGNIVPACLSCNSSKHDKWPWVWAQGKGITPKDAFFARLALAHEQGTAIEPEDDCA